MTMNDTWGFNRADQKWKSTTTLLRHLCDIASKGGNFLLNVGPTADGTIPEASVTRLREIGRWMKTNGESIYGTKASPFTKLPWGRCTQKSRDGVTTLYLHVFEWPADGNLPVPGLKSEIDHASLLSSGERLSVSRPGLYPTLTVPALAPDPAVSVIKLVLKGTLSVDSLLPRPGADGIITLGPKDADLHSTFANVVELAGPEGHPFIAHPAPESWITWSFEIPAPGIYTVVAELAAAKPGSVYRVTCGTSAFEAKIPLTPDAETFTMVTLGQVELSKKGVQEITLRPVKEGWSGVHLRKIILQPKP